jgi:hypothetical protein
MRTFPKMIVCYIRFDSVINTYFAERHFDDGSISRMGKHLKACPESIEILKAQWPGAIVWLLKSLPADSVGHVRLGKLG